MEVIALQDKIARGLGVAARKLGRACVVYRPKSVSSPIDERNRVITLMACFQSEGTSGSGGAGFQPLWHGLFDTAYTLPGDYIVGTDNTYFVGSQTPAQPVRCVLTNRTVTVIRPAFSNQGGYNGLYASRGIPVITAWPASVFAAGGSTRGVKAGNSGLGDWTVLLPRLQAEPRVADVITDDIGGTYLVSAREQDSLGWRLLARQTSA